MEAYHSDNICTFSYMCSLQSIHGRRATTVSACKCDELEMHNVSSKHVTYCDTKLHVVLVGLSLESLPLI